jgi:hypothetical protein
MKITAANLKTGDRMTNGTQVVSTRATMRGMIEVKTTSGLTALLPMWAKVQITN